MSNYRSRFIYNGEEVYDYLIDILYDLGLFNLDAHSRLTECSACIEEIMSSQVDLDQNLKSLNS